MFSVFHVLAFCVWIAACPPWLAPTPATPGQWGGGGYTMRRMLNSCRSHPAQVVVVVDWPQGPDPLPGRRVSTRPQSMRTP